MRGFLRAVHGPHIRRLHGVQLSEDHAAEWREELNAEPELFYGMIARPDVVPFGGGVPVRLDERLAGAVAVSGATSIQDHEIATRAAAAAGRGRAEALPAAGANRDKQNRGAVPG